MVGKRVAVSAFVVALAVILLLPEAHPAWASAGGLKCWGNNEFGQLGDGTNTNRSTPVDVTGLTSGVAAVAAGAFHTCALTTAGGLECWGNNWWDQLGDGTNTNRSTPVDVTDLTSGVAAVDAGYGQTCALTTAGGLKCWGNNEFGQLGDGTNTNRSTPVDVTGLTSGVAALAAGGYHTCALTTAGGVKCWGWNQYGQLGDGTDSEQHTPVDVTGLTTGVAALAAGSNYTCALTTADGLKCWGFNDSGALGDGTNTNRWTPVDVSGLTSGVVAVAAGEEHTCALTAAGGVKCWGYNYHGPLGDGTNTGRNTPVDVTGLTTGVAAVGAAGTHTCALTTAGGVKCWGGNHIGELGDGTNTERWTPVDVSSLTSGVAAVAVGGTHTCAVAGPPSVGGIVQLHDTLQGPASHSGSSARKDAALVTAVAATILALTTGAWYSRRRRLG